MTKCFTCNQEIDPNCEFNQGRCPHALPLLKTEIQPKDTSRGHFYVSLVKSVLRIGAGAAFILGHINIGGFLLILAEFLGILEEIV
jgi:hypothetical protein